MRDCVRLLFPVLLLAGCDSQDHTHDAEYRVSGTGPSGTPRAEISYLVNLDTLRTEATLPWTHRYEAEHDRPYFISARLLGEAGQVTAGLWIGGREVRSATAQGQNATATVRASPR